MGRDEQGKLSCGVYLQDVRAPIFSAIPEGGGKERPSSSFKLVLAHSSIEEGRKGGEEVALLSPLLGGGKKGRKGFFCYWGHPRNNRQLTIFLEGRRGKRLPWKEGEGEKGLLTVFSTRLRAAKGIGKEEGGYSSLRLSRRREKKGGSRLARKISLPLEGNEREGESPI